MHPSVKYCHINYLSYVNAIGELVQFIGTICALLMVTLPLRENNRV